MTNTETVSTERLREIVDGFTGLEFCADSDRLSPDETLSIAAELLASRTQSPAEPDQWRDLALQFDGHRIEALSILRGILAHNIIKHDCGAREFLAKPPLTGEAVLAARIEALRAASIPAPERSMDVLRAVRAIFKVEYSNDGRVLAVSHDSEALRPMVAMLDAALETPPLHKEGEAFGTAWQTNYTGDGWHFAREASFSSSDLERGIVKNVTPLYAAPVPLTITDGWQSQALSAVALPDELEVTKKLKAVIDDFDAEVTAALGREERPDLWDGGVDVHVSLIREAHSTIAALRAKLDEALLCQQEIAAGTDKSATVARIIIAKNEAEGRAETAEAEVKRLPEEKEALRDLADRLKLEAQGHASEAKTANSTIYEIYQVLSGGKGEPGNWHGAEPARRYVEAAEARIKALEEALSFVHRWAVQKEGNGTSAEERLSAIAHHPGIQALSGSKE